MKLAVLISVLIASCYCHLTSQVNIWGNLTCSVPFDYRVTLLEEDNSNTHDIIGEQETRHSNGNSAPYSISGEAYDGFFEWYVEPAVVIEHNCGRSEGFLFYHCPYSTA